MKQCLLAWLAVFVTWSVLDILIHGVALQSLYAAMPELWRPMDEMKMGLMHVVVLIASGTFVGIYSRFVTEKSVKTGVLYGLIFGLGSATSMAYGMYAVMPVQYELALGWFVGSLVETTIGGLLVGLIAKQCCASSVTSTPTT